MPHLRRLAVALSAVLLGCGRAGPAPFTSDNPFATASPLFDQAPPFDRIHDADFQPALEEGMRRQLAEVAAIATDTAAPTFDNTIVALERSGHAAAPGRQGLLRAHAARTPTTRSSRCRRTEAPRLAAHSDAIFLNDTLFRRIKSLYDRRATLGPRLGAAVPGAALLPRLRAGGRAAGRLRQDEAARAEPGGGDAHAPSSRSGCWPPPRRARSSWTTRPSSTA